MPASRLSRPHVFTVLVVLGWSLLTNEASRGSTTDLYVSPAGKDQWSGRLASPNKDSSDGPFATLQKARDAIRALRTSTGLPEFGVTVWLTPGTHSLEQGLELTAEDSGQADKLIVYRAVTEGRARVSGGRTVTGWRKVEDPAILARLDPAARGNVLQADLKAQGIADFGRFRSRGFGRTAVPAALELFFKDQPMILAQWPNTGFEKIAGAPDTARDEHGGTLGKLAAAGFAVESGHYGNEYIVKLA